MERTHSRLHATKLNHFCSKNIIVVAKRKETKARLFLSSTTAYLTEGRFIPRKVKLLAQTNIGLQDILTH